VTSPASVLASIETALDGVTGLRAQLRQGKATTPGAIVLLDGITAPSALGGSADYQIRVLLLVQLGEVRDSLERVLEFINPDGTTATSVLAALLSVSAVGQVTFEGPGLVPWGGQDYAGGIFTVEAFG
jgi:hypothetical protein